MYLFWLGTKGRMKSDVIYCCISTSQQTTFLYYSRKCQKKEREETGDSGAGEAKKQLQVNVYIYY